jgi:hypothetical protein
LLVFIFQGCINEKNGMKKDETDSAVGKDLRNSIFSLKPQEAGFIKDSRFNNVYGVITEFNIEDVSISIVALKDGNASLYTTSSFGIIGGISHESVRIAAENCVQMAKEYLSEGNYVKEYNYPPKKNVYYYILTFDGVKLIIGSEKDLENGNDKTYKLFDSAQKLLTELRLVSDIK